MWFFSGTNRRGAVRKIGPIRKTSNNAGGDRGRILDEAERMESRWGQLLRSEGSPSRLNAFDPAPADLICKISQVGKQSGSETEF